MIRLTAARELLSFAMDAVSLKLQASGFTGKHFRVLALYRNSRTLWPINQLHLAYASVFRGGGGDFKEITQMPWLSSTVHGRRAESRSHIRKQILQNKDRNPQFVYKLLTISGSGIK